MTDLTEKWKNGKLKEGVYYIEYKGIYTDDLYVHFDFYNGKQWKNFKNINRVLAPVPSYEEWQEIKEFADYSLHNRYELTRQINFWMDKHTQIEKENDKLKELLEECRDIVSENLEFSKSIGRNRIQSRNKRLLKRITRYWNDNE